MLKFIRFNSSRALTCKPSGALDFNLSLVAIAKHIRPLRWHHEATLPSLQSTSRMTEGTSLHLVKIKPSS